MEKEQESLLVKVLCGGIPHKWNIEITDTNETEELYSVEEVGQWVVNGRIPTENVKPYLRPLSSMTEDELNEIKRRWLFTQNCNDDGSISELFDRGRLELCSVFVMLDWFNEHRFDYCGLIEKGLALEAPSSMYGKGDGDE